MNINIETKFNIGDIVYLAESYEEFSPSKPLTVVCIFVKVTQDNIFIEYGLCGEGYYERIIEDMIFATYEECSKRCRIYNKN